MSWQFSADIIPYLLAVATPAFLGLLVLLRRQASGAKVFANQHPVQDRLPNPEKYYQLLFESTGDAIILSNLQGEIVECNPSASTIFGYAKQELLGCPLSTVIDTQSVISGPEAITRLRRNGFAIFEGIGRGKSGTEFPLEIRTRQINFEGEQFIFTQAEDITSRRKVETALQKSLGKARSFYELSRTALAVEHLPDTLQAISDGLAQALHADQVITIIFDQDQEKILHYIRGGARSDQIAFLSPQELRQGLTGWVMREKKPALSPKGRTDPRESRKLQEKRRAAQAGAVLVVPVMREDQVTGAITAIHHQDQPNFTQQDAEFSMAIANQVAIAIQQTARLEDVQRRLQAAETLQNSGTAVAASLQQDETIEKILEQLALVVPYDSASVQLLGDGYLEIVGGRGWSHPKAVIGIRFPVPADNPNTQVILSRRPHLLGDAASSHASFFSEPHSHINSWLGVPMIVGNQVIGMLTLDSTNKDFFSEHHAQQVLAFADHVAIAIENARLFAEVQTKAITDSLTGLYNRRGLFELGQRELDRIRRFERPLAAIMLDIDYFKAVNDTYSHAIGDQVLKELAARCRTHLREIDILGRYGGEEFAILLPETGPEDACQIAERMRRHMTAAPVQTGQGPVSITISLGVTAANQDTPDLAILLDRADTAMYAAKQSGRNRVAVR